MPQQLFSLVIGIGKALVTVLFYYRTLGAQRRFLRFFAVLGPFLLAFGILYRIRPEWYFLSSEAETLASTCFAFFEAVATVVLLWLLSRRPCLEIVLFFCLRLLIMTVSSLLPFALFALFAGDSVAQLVAIQWNDALFSFISAVLDMGLLIAAAELISHFIRKQTVDLRWSQFVPVVGAQAVSLGLVAAMRESSNSYAAMLAVLAVLVVVYCIADGVLVSSFRAFVKNSELERDVSALQQQQALQKDYYLSMHEQLKNAQRMRHDYKNTVQTLDALIARGETQKARDFAREYRSELNAGDLVVYTGHEILDAVLSNKSELARRAGVALSLQLTLPDPMPVTDADLMSVFANLLDNAVEYVSALPEGIGRKIEVECKVFAGLWAICVSNTYVGRHPPSFFTTKADKERHGHGMEIVRSIARKYDGTITADVEDGKLNLRVTLNMACRK